MVETNWWSGSCVGAFIARLFVILLAIFLFVARARNIAVAFTWKVEIVEHVFQLGLYKIVVLFLVELGCYNLISLFLGYFNGLGY